ncbi:MEKK and related serine/threonine protein kinases amardillo repeat-containing protein [Ectocarpus siliculosus]|uniref:non-specific serine/threonine protein kinase n=1 Tax=Ectocarpus siliculosus TaxID=2880 RepID=D8LLC1_ECTSI|nr:MEKK and related serine/threonine protein kinases amardillo repeat-containing protein [Ectocarpus siliculosus]|eukprot:CBN77119.1 MEKK and related serine/threonine protein kinases amardillo repeat-containing protein [Ectocarpus siliculosus]
MCFERTRRQPQPFVLFFVFVNLKNAAFVFACVLRFDGHAWNGTVPPVGEQQIGQEIGRGGFGVVFQALNTATGDFVAVKRMEMDSVKLDAGASIKGEIDLLKKLNHPNIVQYIDTIQTSEHLHIVLEIMESSLSAMCKKFGNFSESLTAIYMTQVLEGLKYLHDQGVLHRDIKGANILTTKRGLVKLADFGVAMKLSDKQAFDVDVVGTPYWMAPEIIEMTGTTTACDVWSVGCTIIELLEGKPPYFDLPQMTALYKIVQDDHPPLPDGTSQALRDFLLQCFKKQAQMRKSSVELLRHPWLKNPTNHLRKGGAAAGQQGQGAGGAPAPAPAPKAKPKASPLSSGAGGARRGNIPPPAAAALAAANRRGAAEDGQGWDQDWDRELGFVAPSLAVGSLPATGSGGQQQPAAAAAAETGMAPASEEAKHRLRALKEAEEQARNQPLALKKMSLDANALDDWADDDDDDDDGFGDGDAFDAFDLAIASGNGKAGAGCGGLAGAGAGLVRGGAAAGAGGDGGGVIGMEATVLRRFMEDEEEEEDAFGDIDIDVPGDGPLLPTAMGEGERSRPASFADNLKAKMLSHQGGSAAPASGVSQAATDEASGSAAGAFDDFDDLFGTGFEDLSDGEEGSNGKEAEREMHAKVGQEVFAELSRLETRGSVAGNNSGNLRSGDGQQKGRGGGGTAAVSGNATGGVSTGRLLGTVTEVEEIDEEEEVTMEEEVVRTCVSVCERLEGCPQARHYVMSADRGVTPLMYLMQAMKPEDRQGEEAMANVLAVINKIVEDNLKALESLAVVGLVPKVMTILETRGAWDEEGAEGKTAAEAPAGSGLCLPQGGEEDSSKKTDNGQKPPPRRRGSGYSSIGSGNRPKDTFSRFLGHSMIATSSSPSSSERISAGLQQTSGGCLLEREVSSMAIVVGTTGAAAAAAAGGGGGGGDMFWPYVTRAAEILTTFSKSDGVVKEGVAEEHCLQGVMRALSSICPAYLGLPRFCSLAVTLLTVLKNLSMEPSTLEALDKAGAITTLVSLLAAGVMGAAGSGGGVDEDLENQVLQCMFYLCRISRKRQEKAARAGLIPHLRRCVLEQSRLKQFALQMVCDFAHTSGVVRSLMWDEGVLDFYLSVMRSPKDTHWHVTIFRSLCAWLSSEGETERVAGRLVEPLNLDKVICLFCTAQQVDFEEVVDKLHLMMVKSQTLVKALGSSATFIVEVMERLHYPKAVVGKTLLGMLRMIHHQHPDPAALVRDFDLYRIVLTLARNESQVLVAELAGQLLQDFDRGGGGGAAVDTGGCGGGGGGGGQKGSVGEAVAAAMSEPKPVSPSAPPPPPPPHAVPRPPPPPPPPEFASAAAAACSEEGGIEEKKGGGSGEGGGRAKPREEAAEKKRPPGGGGGRPGPSEGKGGGREGGKGEKKVMGGAGGGGGGTGSACRSVWWLPSCPFESAGKAVVG